MKVKSIITCLLISLISCSCSKTLERKKPIDDEKFKDWAYGLSYDQVFQSFTIEYEDNITGFDGEKSKNTYSESYAYHEESSLEPAGYYPSQSVGSGTFFIGNEIEAREYFKRYSSGFEGSFVCYEKAIEIVRYSDFYLTEYDKDRFGGLYKEGAHFVETEAIVFSFNSKGYMTGATQKVDQRIYYYDSSMENKVAVSSLVAKITYKK